MSCIFKDTIVVFVHINGKLDTIVVKKGPLPDVF